MPRPTCYTKSIGTLSLWVQTKTPPSDAEWETALKELSVNHARALVFTDGGAPNSLQRKRLSETISGRGETVSAVLSYAMIPRFVNASIALFLKSLRSYNPEEFPQAIAYVNITNEEKDIIIAELFKAQSSLGIENTVTVTRALKAANWI
jgi:hypothetical protein